MSLTHSDIYSIIITVHPPYEQPSDIGQDWRLGEITVDWVDFTREKSTDTREKLEDAPRSPDKHKHRNNTMHTIPGAAPPTPDTPESHRKPKPRRKKPEDVDDLSLQPLLGHYPGPNPVGTDAAASGITNVGRGVVHLFRHAPPASLIARLEGQNGESSRVSKQRTEAWAGEHAEGEDGSLLAILAVPAWMRPADLLEFLGGWVTGLEGVRMIRWVKVPSLP